MLTRLGAGIVGRVTAKIEFGDRRVRYAAGANVTLTHAGLRETEGLENG
jgi:hypothetical protein